LRSLKELWKISKPFYLDTYLSGQTKYRAIRDVNKLLKSLSLNSTFLKIIISFVLLANLLFSRSIIALTAFLLITMFFFSFFFLNFTTEFVSMSFDLLRTLPLKDDEIAVVRFMVLFRIFDIPLVVIAVFYPLITCYFYGIKALIPSILSIVSLEIISIYIAIRLARLFYEKIAYSTGSTFSTILRVLAYFLWAIAFMGIYMASSLVEMLSKKNYNLMKYDFIFPVNYATISCGIFDFKAVISSAVFIILSYLAYKKLCSELSKEAKIRVQTGKMKIKVSKPIVAFIKKDLRVVTRNPGATLLIFMPMIEAIFMSYLNVMKGFLIQAMITSVVMGFLPMVVLIFSGMEKRELLKTLPVKNRTVRVSKTVIGCLVYLSVLIPLIFRTFISLALFPAVLTMSAASSYMAEKLDISRNIQTESIKAILVFLVCYTILYAPVICGFIVHFLKPSYELVAITLAGIAELPLAVWFLANER